MDTFGLLRSRCLQNDLRDLQGRSAARLRVGSPQFNGDGRVSARSLLYAAAVTRTLNVAAAAGVELLPLSGGSSRMIIAEAL